MEAAAAMDFHALSRRELQALCKRNGVRANMTNAAMADALQGLTSVDGIDEIGTTLCLPTPGRSAMRSAAKMAQLVGEEQHGSPLPRGRRVSVKSPEAIRMEVEEGEYEMKRDLVKEIVRTPGVALRSTSRRARATPAPLPTPVPASRATTRRTATRKTEEVAPTPATLRRSQRTAGRKAAAPKEVEQPADDVSAEKMPTRSARSKMTMALDQEEEVAAAMPKVEEKQQEEPKAVASDVKCDDPDEDEVTKILEGDNKEEEPEVGEEADSSDVTIGSAVASDNNCLDNKMEEEATKPQEGFVEEKEPTSIEKPASLATMEDSPILGVLSKAEASEQDIVKAQDASVEDDEGCAEWSPVMKMADEINEEAIQEDACTPTGETDHCAEEILPTATEEDGLTEVKKGASLQDDEGADNEMLQAELADVETSEEDEEELPAELKGAVDEMRQAELADNETSEDRLAEQKEEAYVMMPQPELTDVEASDEDEEIYSTEGSDEDEEIYSTEGSDEEAGETSDESDTTNAVQKLQGTVISEAANADDDFSDESDTADVVQMLQGTVISEAANEDASTEDDDFSDESDTADVVQMLQGPVIAEEANEDASTEDDDFSSDLPPEFDNLVFSDFDTENDTAALVLEENQAVVASATKTDVKSMVDSAITEEQKEELDNIVKSLDDFTIKEGEATEEIQELPQAANFESMSLRKLKSTLKERLIASKDGKVVADGKRLPLEEVDENASVDC